MRAYCHTCMYTVTLVQKYILFAPGTSIGKCYKWPVHPTCPQCLAHFVSCALQGPTGLSQLTATLRVKSIFHKQGQRAWAGREYKQLPRRNQATWGAQQGSSENWGRGEGGGGVDQARCSHKSKGSKSELSL